MIARVGNDALEGVAGSRSAQGKRQVVVLQLLQRQHGAGCQGMMLVDDGSKLVAEQHPTVDAGIVLQRFKGQHKVELVVLEPPDKVGHVRLTHVYLHLRIAAEESRQRLSHDTGKGEGDADIQFATHQVLQLVQPEQTVVGCIHRLLGKRQKRLPCLGEHHLMTVAVKQRLSQFILQLQNLVRERALGDKQFPGCR